MKPTQKDLDPMDEAYKHLDGKPSATGVSEAAMGIKPKNDDEQFAQDEHDQQERQYGKTCGDIDDAYAMLFESLAVIMKSKS